MPNLFVKSNIKHNGVNYVAGDVIQNATEEQAKQLIEVGSAQLVNSKSEQKRVATMADLEKADDTNVEETTEEAEETETEQEMVTVKNSKKEILEYAKSVGVELDPALSKAEMIEELESRAEAIE